MARIDLPPIHTEEFLGMLREALFAPDDLMRFARLVHRREFMDPLVEPLAEDASFMDRHGDALLDLLNSYSRRYRERCYRERMRAGYDGIRIVSEGDSWFQYPFQLRDVIDHLSESYAVLSRGRAGDTLANIIAEKEQDIFAPLAQEQPHFFLISGGGNDMVGNRGLARLVAPFAADRAPQAYADTPAFEAFIDDLVGQYRALFVEIDARHPGVQILLHGYDAPIPGHDDDLWLGEPLRFRGIHDPQLQVQIMVAIMDRYNDALADLAAGFDHVHHVNCRDCLAPDHWHDPMHPTSEGYAAVAARFDARIRELTAALHPQIVLR
jgi:hypothetical protein